MTDPIGLKISLHWVIAGDDFFQFRFYDFVVGANGHSWKVNFPDGIVCAFNCCNGRGVSPLGVDRFEQDDSQTHGCAEDNQPEESVW